MAVDFGDFGGELALELKELLRNNLNIIFETAIQKIMANGYTKEAATMALMRTDIFNGLEVTVLVEHAITLVRAYHQKDILRHYFFEDLEQFKRYTLVGLILFLLDLRPSLSFGDVVWYLLICDLNFVEAYELAGETVTSNNSGNAGPSRENSSALSENKGDGEIETSESDVPNPFTPIASTSPLPSEVPSESRFPNLTKSKISSISCNLSSNMRISSNINDVVKSDVSGLSQMLPASEGMSNNGQKVNLSDIIKLWTRLQELNSQLEEWAKWTDQKVMQVVCRLQKNSNELKSLRQEKEDAEKLRRNLKKLAEMETTLCETRGELELADAASQILEVANAVLKQQMEIARCQSTESDAKFQEALTNEKRTLMKIQSLGKQNMLLEEELSIEKRKSAEIQKKFDCAKHVLGQVEARLEQEVKLQKDLKVQASLIREEMEQAEAIAKSKDELAMLKAENNLLKFKDDIRKLESEISQLRLNNDRSNVDSPKKGIDECYASKTADTRNKIPAYTLELDLVPLGVTAADLKEDEIRERQDRELKAGLHPLNHKFVFWFTWKTPRVRTQTSYEDNIKKIAEFSTVEDFWFCYCHLNRPASLPSSTDLHLFKEGIRPLWEDSANCNGGKWIIRFMKAVSGRFWEDLVLAFVGDELDYGDNVCGAVLSIRHNEDLVSVWNRDASDQQVVMALRDSIKHHLRLPHSYVMEYKPHDASSLRDNSS